MAESAGPVFVSGEAVQAVFRWEDAVGALQEAYSRAASESALPPRTIAHGEAAILRTLPAMPPGCRYFGAKMMGIAMNAPSPGVDYVIVLYDRQTSRIAAFVDATLVTAFRTAATSAAALDRLAKPGPARLGVLGSGLEASTHARAFAAVRPLSEILVFSPRAERREAFAEAVQKDLGVAARAVDRPEAAVESADIVLAAARAYGERPILHGDWLRPGQTVVSIGSTAPEQREIDTTVVAKTDFIVCDVVHEVLYESGDMIAAREAGLDAEDRCYSLNALLMSQIEDQRRAARLPMFKSVGGGLQDVVVAGLVLEKALAAGLATPLPIKFQTKFL